MIQHVIVLLLACLGWKVSAQVTLEANYTRIPGGQDTMSAFFYCKAGRDQLFYLNHVLTWSKIGRDGRERYLSINWDLVQHGVNQGYHVETRTTSSSAGNMQTNMASEPVMFVLWKKDLVPSDHGEYICRLHDFDRNMIAEERFPVTVYDGGLAMSPFRIESKAGKHVTIKCMVDSLLTGVGHVDLYHVTKDGISTRVVRDGKLDTQAPGTKYSFATSVDEFNISHNILSIQNLGKLDQGHIVCDLVVKKVKVATTNATISVDTPKLQITPLYYLKVPHDAGASFKCDCSSVRLNASCHYNQLWWSLSNQTSGEVTDIYKNDRLLGDPKVYDIVHEDITSTNLTIHSMQEGITEGDFVCSLHDNVTGEEITHASLPVSVIPVSFRSMALMEQHPSGLSNVRLLCILSGTSWDAHYFDNHNIVWLRKRGDVTEKMASNSAFMSPVDTARYTLLFDSKHNYSILTVNAIEPSDHGDYVCSLQNTFTTEVIQTRTLKMYGKDNTTMFGV